LLLHPHPRDHWSAVDEFDRQLTVLSRLGLPELTGVSAREFKDSLVPLREAVEGLPAGGSRADDRKAFIVVPSLRGRSAASLVPLMHLAGSDRPGILDRNHGDQGLAPYAPVSELEVPVDEPYLLVDLDRGDEFCGVRPRDAVVSIGAAGRTPLTITEGIIAQLVEPALLQRNRCFMLAGSRRGDKRVPALWISEGAPKLGWCWEGNPHSWLGTASAAARLTRVAAPSR
jgi:hypothetical protein